MPTVRLSDRALVEVAGPEAESFLQNVLTNDFGGLGTQEARPGALLTPQGKILFDYLVSRREEEGFLFECRADVVDDFVKRLMLYRLRAKAEILKRDEPVVAVSWDEETAPPDARPEAVIDRRFPEDRNVIRRYGSAPSADADMEDWHLLRIACAVPESGRDFELQDAFPHEILFDQNGGVGLKKGCFVGQEVVSRMHHRGTARRRLVIVNGEAALPVSGTGITAAGRPIGTLGTAVGDKGLAVMRLDRAGDAMNDGTPILAGEVPIAVSIPAWTNIRFPQAAPSDEGA